MSKKKTSKKAAEKSKESQEKTPATSRTLKKGTLVRFPGGVTDLVLEGDVSVSYPNVASDEKFAGMLSKHLANFRLNIDQLEGVWSPVTGRREE